MSAGRTPGPAVAPVIVPLRTEHDCCRLDTTTPKNVPPALIVNPEAGIVSVLAAAVSRAERLRMSLEAWWAASASDNLGSVKMSEVIEPLWPLAEEVLLLIEAAQSLAHDAGRQS